MNKNVRVCAAVILSMSAQASFAQFLRGDANADGKLQISDPICILSHLFQSRALPNCADAADVNDDGRIDIADPICLLGYLFGRGACPPPPFPMPGWDLRADDPFVECDNPFGNLPGPSFYRTAEMARPRYEHSAAALDDGTVAVFGGTDERCFTSIDACEIFDQTLAVAPAPPSLSGGWITTDFEGEDVRLPDGGRVFHTSTRLAEGKVIIIGGAPDAVLGEPYEHPALFDRHTRKCAALSASLGGRRFHHTACAVTEGEIIVFGGQTHVAMTIVHPEYPPSDPRFIEEINTFPSTNSIEVFDSSLPSDDGQGDFAVLVDNDGNAVTLPSHYGRALHATVRIAGLDNSLGDPADIYVCVAGIVTLSPIGAPTTKLRRMQLNQTQLMNTVDVYDAAGKTCFIAPGIYLERNRAHGVMAENLGWHSDRTYDGYRGLSNTFLVCGGSDDTLPTTGVALSEGFAATYSGFGPGGGITLLRLHAADGETLDTIFEVVSSEIPGLLLNTDLVSAVRSCLARAAAPVAERRIGKYFGSELLADQQLAATLPISRVHTQAVRLLRRVVTPRGAMDLGMIFTGGGGHFSVAAGAQVEVYDASTTASGEYFDPNYTLFNAFLLPPRNPYDLTTMRAYWHVKYFVPLPAPDDPGRHPNPAGIDGAWLAVDDLVPGADFDGYRLFGQAAGVRSMEKGRAWHTMSVIPGAGGIVGDVDDCVLFAGGGDSVLSYGGLPVIPSAIIFVPPSGE